MKKEVKVTLVDQKGNEFLYSESEGFVGASPTDLIVHKVEKKENTKMSGDAARVVDDGTVVKPVEVNTENSTVDIVRNFLKNKTEPVSRSEVMEGTGVTATQWMAAIKTLLSSGAVSQTGVKKGAKYTFNR